MTAERSNREIANQLARHARLLEAAGESAFRARAYTRAAEALREVQEPLADIRAQGRLREIPGIGEGIAAAISQILDTGGFDAHRDLTGRFPESLLELTTIPSVGAKTALKLHTLLGIESIDSLEAALVAGQVASTKGLGARAEATISEGLAALRRRTGRTPLGIALPVARSLVAAFVRARPADTISVAGSARRWETTVADLDFVIATDNVEAALSEVTAIPMVTEAERVSDSAAHLRLDSGLEADVYLTAPECWGSVLVRATGSERHLARLGDIPHQAATEAEVYAGQGLPWIPPELRQGNEEFERWADIDALVELGDINGEFHAHTTWSDGGASIEAMAAAARQRGYTFLGITDHSHGLGVAGGLDPIRLALQRAELTALDGVVGLKLLAGAEVEVHRDGRLDYSDEILAQLDVVVASLHTGLRQPREEITDRLLRVLENPNVDIIAHPTGRLIERREGGDFDWDRVFPTAARTGTALEINADPARLDLDPELARRAKAAGCLITINCDAHSPEGFSLMEYGVAMARRAWLTPQDVLNCRSCDAVLDWLASRGRPV